MTQQDNRDKHIPRSAMEAVEKGENANDVDKLLETFMKPHKAGDPSVDEKIEQRALAAAVSPEAVLAREAEEKASSIEQSEIMIATAEAAREGELAAYEERTTQMENQVNSRIANLEKHLTTMAAAKEKAIKQIKNQYDDEINGLKKRIAVEQAWLKEYNSNLQKETQKVPVVKKKQQ